MEEDIPSTVLQGLIEQSFQMKSRAYCRYSKFRVGAVLLCTDGTIFTGCNVENASYGLCICAERTALVKAVSEGYSTFKAIVISSDLKASFIYPCGACRQFLVEFGTDWDVYVTKPDKTYKRHKVSELVPYSFNPHTMEEERISQTA